ncbi:hypothetical protein GCM10012288_08160 [Malaciobacter pacificus]|jgi:tetratricopeptide (TPR) repeat protein|uniref:Uncharacterized protein n=1 Tax=Malaciobacter pacificus TaxID=1080223 RepID=A0A5C2H8J6_9BACT|nr:hypothetical protein [Malaciobacter pacificus]QEP35133.1 hypothetical protein APAC_2061 [Malaciobacter pacificus]GGD36498.1 hypothetical protein GCM10012288_08160 [Malaciobacter pacificus]
MKLLYKLLLIFCCNILYANDLIESQPEILFKFDKLKKSQKNLALQVDFNKAVLLLSKGEYKEAIELFKKTEGIMYVPSNLNIGIAYYKLNSIDNAILYLTKIYENENFIKTNSFSYMSASFYLYQITKDNKYLDKIVKISKKYRELSEHSKRMLADTYIILKDYKSALMVLESMDFAMTLKKALIHIKLQDYEKARRFLQKAKDETSNPNTINDILWFETFINLKSNKIKLLKENLDEINKRRILFKTNLELPLEMFFNENKYTSKQYLDLILNFTENRKIDFIYYFAPFIFSDTQEVIYDTVKGLMHKEELGIENLEQMVEYNGKFLSVVKDDPILRVTELRKYLGENSKSYVYYNYALACTHIFDFNTAFTYFQKAYKLNPGNKLFASMVLITAKRINKFIPDKDYIESNINSKNGLYEYFGKELYRLFINQASKNSVQAKDYELTVFFKALDFMEQMNEGKVDINHPLLDEHIKDPLTYLIRLVQRRPGENDFNYYSRLQDTVPLSINNNFLEGPLLITQYYIDLLKSIGLFLKADMKIIGKKSPSYLRTQALRNLHLNKPDETIKTIEYLQKEYKLEDKYNMYLMVAALLKAGRYNDASIQISLIKAVLKDPGADFLTAVQLIQELKLISAKQYLKEPYSDSLIDFRLLGFDEYLESL